MTPTTGIELRRRDYGADPSNLADWDTPLQKLLPPTKAASPALIADHLVRQEMDQGYRLSTTDIAQFCKQLEAEPLSVYEKLMAYRHGSASYSLEDVTVSVDDEAFERLWDEDKTARCPIRGWQIDPVTGREVRFTRDCNSWECSVHSPAKAERELARARDEFGRRQEVWFAEVPYDYRFVYCIRFRRRPERGGGGTVLVRREEGRLLCFATRSMTAHVGEKRWVPLSHEEATERFAAALTLPGIIRVQWSAQGWTATG